MLGGHFPVNWLQLPVAGSQQFTVVGGGFVHCEQSDTVCQSGGQPNKV